MSEKQSGLWSAVITHCLLTAPECKFEEFGTGENWGPSGRGHGEIEYDWPSKPSECEHVRIDDVFEDSDGYLTVIVSGVIEGKSSRQTLRAKRNPPGKAHPAEYETVTHELGFTIEWKPERQFTGEVFHTVVELIG